MPRSRLLNRTIHRLRKLAALDRRGLDELIRAQAALLAAQMLVWTRPVGELTRTGAPSPPRRDERGDDATARRWALAIDRAATHGVFRPLCLVRALALQRILEANHLPGSHIRIGVRRYQGRFIAHAWVEYGDLPLGDDAAQARRFVPLNEVQVTGPR